MGQRIEPMNGQCGAEYPIDRYISRMKMGELVQEDPAKFLGIDRRNEGLREQNSGPQPSQQNRCGHRRCYNQPDRGCNPCV